MKVKEVLHKTVAAPWGLAIDLENQVIEAMEAYANLQIEQLRSDFLEQLQNKNGDIQDLNHELYVLKDLFNVHQAEASTMKCTYEVLIKAVAKEAWDYVDNRHARSFFSESFEEWYGKRQLTVGDV
jgi:hypothetical protein